MDRIDKNLLKLNQKQRKSILEKFSSSAGDTVGLNIKKIRGRKNTYRLRDGKVRLVYEVMEDACVILFVGMRDDQTYRDF